MKKNYTHIAILLDRSGSMSSIASDMEGGLKTFLNKQKEIPGELTVTLAQFNNRYNLIFNRKSASEIKDITIDPFGSTALIDSACKLISDVGKDLDSLPEEERPEKVLVVIITDGEENSSREFSLQQLKDMISHQETTYNWNFVYTGANQDSFANSYQYGIQKGSTLNFSASTESVNTMYRVMNDATTRYRSVDIKDQVLFSFTQEEQNESDKQ